MGCDYSMIVKQNFTLLITDMWNIERKIERKQKRLTGVIYEFKNLISPEVEVASICEDLGGQLTRIERILEEIKEVKSSEVSFNREVSIDSIPVKESVKKFKVNVNSADRYKGIATNHSDE